MLKVLKAIMKITLSLAVLLCLFLGILTAYVYLSTENQIHDLEDDFEKKDYVLILGCGINGDEPTPLLKSRLDAGIEAFNKSGAKKIIVSGYVEEPYYNEVKVMKNYLLKNGIALRYIEEDGLGKDTYASIKNAINNGYSSSLYIVTQDSHLRRALFLANSLLFDGDVAGVRAKAINHAPTMRYMDTREIFARVKAVFDIMGIDLHIYLTRFNI